MSETEAMTKVSAGTDAARSAASDVASEAGDQAKEVMAEAKTQVSDLVTSTRQEVKGQARIQTQRAAERMRTLAGQARALSDGRPQDAGVLGDWLREAEQRLSHWAGRLEHRGPEGLLGDVTALARRRPAAFLGVCLGTGLVVGRLAKDSAAGTPGRGGASQLPAPTTGALPAVPPDGDVQPRSSERPDTSGNLTATARDVPVGTSTRTSSFTAEQDLGS
jgi:hypothetical protein